MTFLFIASLAVAAGLIITGGTNIDFRDCWGRDRVETVRWVCASWVRWTAGVVLLIAAWAST